MSVFQIKHGAMPEGATLAEGELGFDTTNKNLYIGDGTSMKQINTNIVIDSIEPETKKASLADGDIYIYVPDLTI